MNSQNTNAPIGRFAPSPTGRIHLGNVFSFLLAWLFTKSQGGKMVLRIENLDTVRCKQEHIENLINDLDWLGLTWDFGNTEEYLQSNCTKLYEHALTEIRQKALVYPCYCTRSELNAQNAPHASDNTPIYNGKCKKDIFSLAQNNKGRKSALRIEVPNKIIAFNDLNYGYQQFNLQAQCGDFVLQRSDGAYAYQLAVVVDDIRMGVNHVVRGNDLLESTAKQLFLYELLNAKPPEYFHIPLLCAPDGKRLSKREKSLSLEQLRKTHSPQQIIGMLGAYANLIPFGNLASCEDLLKVFSPSKIPTQNIITNETV